MTEADYQALLQMWNAGGEPDENAGPWMMVTTLGSLRGIVAEHVALENLREDVRELVLDLDVDDGEIVMVTPETAGILIERMGNA